MAAVRFPRTQSIVELIPHHSKDIQRHCVKPPSWIETTGEAEPEGTKGAPTGVESEPEAVEVGSEVVKEDAEADPKNEYDYVASDADEAEPKAIEEAVVGEAIQEEPKATGRCKISMDAKHCGSNPV